jgi:hypothetical protein
VAGGLETHFAGDETVGEPGVLAFLVQVEILQVFPIVQIVEDAVDTVTPGVLRPWESYQKCFGSATGRAGKVREKNV